MFVRELNSTTVLLPCAPLKKGQVSACAYMHKKIADTATKSGATGARRGNSTARVSASVRLAVSRLGGLVFFRASIRPSVFRSLRSGAVVKVHLPAVSLDVGLSSPSFPRALCVFHDLREVNLVQKRPGNTPKQSNK